MAPKAKRESMMVAILAMAGMFRPVELPRSSAVRWTVPHQNDREKARRRRQITRGLRQAHIRNTDGVWVPA